MCFQIDTIAAAYQQDTRSTIIRKKI